ncbi:cytochrome c oxidase subunit II [Mycobacterium sp. PSTR-4-N]|uniref:cytochrome c oxidase subunit II n=1 Tax=Mycobacterium sp. PSTR-4-N TaxID=2917745 RepID=UPI001F14D0F1|nr:cytochrome c oxidase subunit II [Mycobacterium sp. PSTR-4-N]MCG7593748.1 cytochrome c oxidase subunit II [Mycobacterium sp. PSTR-4-N]
MGAVRKSARAVTAAAVGAATMLAVACSDSSPSALDPGGPPSRRIEQLWWLLFWIAAVVCVIVVIGVVLVVARRRRKSDVEHSNPTTFVLIAGAVAPFVVLATVYGFGLRDTLALSERPSGASDSPPITVEVIGHQWWWEVRYPGQPAVTANEIHIPVDTDVEVKLRTDDVLHSFWVPQLSAKTDLIAGRTNTMWLRADRVGTYRGQCAEYCGMQHAHMAFMVVAQPRADFDAWLRWAGAPATTTTDAQRRGEQVFLQTGCAACHSIRGTPADGVVGPDLTTIGDRWSIGAGTLTNDNEHLRQWITDPQQAKPGNEMPPQAVAPADMPDLIAYLRSLQPSDREAP